jgi:hypothetical protein
MVEYAFRNLVESVRKGESDRYATNCEAKPGDLVMLISGRPAGDFDYVESQPDENPLRAVVEVSQVEAGPLGIRSFLRWKRLVFGSTTPTYQAELAFDRSGHPRYDRLVAISKQLDEVGRRVAIVDLEDGEVLTADLDRLARAVQSEGESDTILGN